MRGCGTGACMRERNAKVKKVNEKGKSKQHGPRAPRAKVKQLVNLQVEKKRTCVMATGREIRRRLQDAAHERGEGRSAERQRCEMAVAVCTGACPQGLGPKKGLKDAGGPTGSMGVILKVRLQDGETEFCANAGKRGGSSGWNPILNEPSWVRLDELEWGLPDESRVPAGPPEIGCMGGISHTSKIPRNLICAKPGRRMY